MPFNTALSGIRAAAKDLSVTGNNIANASTTGFKSSRAEFGDLYASSVLGSSVNAVGSGVRLQNVAQNFTEGNVSFTERDLDMAISGTGFFMLSQGGENLYTRAGTFGTDDEGFIVNNTGARLQGFPADSAGNISGLRGDLRIQTSNLSPRQTTNVQSELNLDASQPALTVAFDPADQTTYNDATSMNVYDSLGNPHVMTQFFVKQPYVPGDATTQPNHWQMIVQIDGQNVGDPATAGGLPTVATFDLHFTEGGSLDAALSDEVLISNWTPLDANGEANGAFGPQTVADGATTVIPEPPTTSNFVLELAGSTQFNEEFGEYNVHQDGYTTGRLSSLSIDDQGLISARFTNGQSQALGQIVLASFANEQGLAPQGGTMWSENFESGQPVVGVPGSSNLGAIQSGALEESNVDLSEQLVQLIVAQRNFQASAKTIETADQTTQTIINLR